MPTDLHFSANDSELSPTAREPRPDSSDSPGQPAAVLDGGLRNAVFLVGEVTEPGEARDLAGGVHAVRWTLRVQRDKDISGTDLIDCVALDMAMQERALGWPQGTTVAVEGALRRRFFHAGGRTTTRVEVEARQVAELAFPEQ